MQVSEQFAKVVRRTILAMIVIVFALALYSHSQNGGTVGIQAQMIPVFTNQSSTKSSGGIWQCGITTGVCSVFQDIGQGTNTLFYCNTGFAGSIDLEWNPSPSTSTTFYPVAQAFYLSSSPDSACHQLSAGAYWPNMRATVTPTAGSLSAWYLSNSGASSPVLAGIGTNGPASPVVCDRNNVSTQASGGTSSIASIGPVESGDTIVICAFSIGFSGATTGGSVAIQWASSTGNCAALSADETWGTYTPSGTPTFLPVAVPQRSGTATTGATALQYPCFNNSSGVNAIISVSYASVHGL